MGEAHGFLSMKDSLMDTAVPVLARLDINKRVEGITTMVMLGDFWTDATYMKRNENLKKFVFRKL